MPDDPLSPLAALHFLVGSWRALSQPGEPTGAFSFTLQAQGHVLVRNNFADYPATRDRPAWRHEDLMVIYLDRHVLRADYYDSEGHVIRYAGNVPEPGAVVFRSDPGDAGPVFRLSYQLEADQALTGRFDIASPAAPDEFRPYLSWSAVRDLADRTHPGARLRRPADLGQVPHRPC